MNSILIAEDEARLAAFLVKGFQKHGFATAVAEDGQQALDMVESGNFELLLLDLGLPIKDGWAVLQEIRHKQSHLLPIIVVTAQDDERNRKAALALGASDYITKPFRFGDLLASVRSQLSTCH
jgi:DNA-binding response OmpR family regulator